MRMRTSLSLLSLLVWLSTSTAQAGIRYVKTDGTGDGTSWSNASGNLQAMLSAAAVGDEIWVAAGTYVPTATRSGNGFSLPGTTITLYGGFPADATDATYLTDRDPDANPTILSGDINGDDTVDVSTGRPLPTNMAENAWHVLDISSLDLGDVVVDGFIIKGGNAANDPLQDTYAPCGGGIRALGTGGYRAFGRLIVRHCEIRGNRAGSGMYFGGSGGGVYTNAVDLLMVRCTVANNVAGNGLDGDSGINDGDWGMVGTAGGHGGGVAAMSCDSATFDRVSFKGNAAGNGGNGGNGSSSLTGSGGGGGNGSDGGTGGAVSLQSIYQATILNCGFFGNQAGNGGNGGNGGNTVAEGMSAGSGGSGASANASSYGFSGCGGGVAMDYCAQVSVQNSTFANNVSGEGGTGGTAGIFTGVVGVNGLVGSDGTGGEGGALFIFQGTTSLENCTFTTNKAAGNGGAVSFSPYYTGTLTGQHLTFAENLADLQGGALALAVIGDQAETALRVVNSIFWGNAVSGNEPGATDSDLWSAFAGMAVDNSILVQAPATVTTSGCIANDPRLKALSWNGGPTPTMAPEAGSPAIDASFLDINQLATTDQRGFARDASPDAGAFEIHQQAHSITLTNLTDASATLSWTPGMWGYSVVFVRSDDPQDPKPRPKDGWYYNPNPAFGTGGYITETPWTCVYAGTGNTVDVTGFTGGTKYSVMVCDTENTVYTHNTEDALDNPLVLETLPSLAPSTLISPVNCPDEGTTGPTDDNPSYGHSLTTEPVFVWDPPADATGAHFEVWLDGSKIGDTAIDPIGFRWFDGTTWTDFPTNGMPATAQRLAFERAGTGQFTIERAAVAEQKWWVVAASTKGATSTSATFRFLSQVPEWVDGVAVAGYSIIRKAQLEQLRDEVTAFRRLRALPDYSFTDPVLTANETPVRTVHFQELRAAIAEAAATTGEDTTAWQWTDPTLVPNQTAVKAAHLQELRNALAGNYPVPAGR